ncbi:MAG TPA: LuxR C-terminal-related transcriptional regulator [Anaerolineales bacterium]|nr:LuxR C-terminal-related transcriptional regulator [Anaerolineales bacterium]
MTHLQALSAREKEVVDLLLKGKSNKLIASALGISDRTVEFHLKNVFHKLQVASRTELILKLGTSTVAGREEMPDNGDSLRAISLKDAVSRIGKELRMENLFGAQEEANPATFFGAIRVCLTKYADFNGQAARAEFWWFALFVTLVTAALGYLSQELASVGSIVLLLPFLAAGARRLRDIGKSAWWLLIILAPVGGLVALAFLWAQPTTDHDPVSA